MAQKNTNQPTNQPASHALLFPLIHLGRLGGADDVVVGHDVPVLVPHKARARARRHLINQRDVYDQEDG